MKKISTQLFIFLFIFSNAYSQIPNPSFENWRSYTANFGTGEQPVGWYTTDSAYIDISSGAAAHSAIKNVTTCDGSFSVQLISVSALGQTAPGAATNGKITGINISNIAGGSPFTLRAAKLTGCYKYVPTASDSGIISAVLVKWNGTARDTIALASSIVGANGGLTNFQIDFVYRSPNSPDTILVLLASGKGLNLTNAGSYLIVDHLATNGLIGIQENSLIKNIDIFPQPAQNELNVHVELNQNISLKYEIADITGRKVIAGKMTSNNEKIDIIGLNRGNYFIALRNEEDAVVYTSKFIVSK